ncbi:MAG: Respiratory supercomplex factor 1, mitochondrial [Heterodermia speciosa]|uniref:Respiratory supercomplex factor 1, mitochondrial n=1 Tax=Heterodermia speciosa TaxID=116794 RepID=A0A8H3IT97_9LECA|nr:MAG: Respiratory supercomplex factor 1, mitochondrial [Heterodermia speciosa]
MSSGQLPSSFEGDEDFYEESRWKKIKRRIKEEPLIPLGTLGTCYALYLASQSIRAGDPVTTNRMFRYRIYGQAFTIVAMIGGSFYHNSDRILRRNYEKVKAEKKAAEKHEAWIRELEVRDREDKDWRERMAKIRDAQREEAERREEKVRRKEELGGGGGVVLNAVMSLGKAKDKVEAVQGKGEEKVDKAKGK